ncbi:lipoprotein LpqH [Gulosibacter faecalis]|uniref:Lipoprotein LpqH n=1 Tax=Gulosibacter faecalis TaxID=272240 RepID=A0ABW5UZ30_9MICO|nr:lipoprotein LpqH [Gulosibacter faecalis]
MARITRLTTRSSALARLRVSAVAGLAAVGLLAGCAGDEPTDDNRADSDGSNLPFGDGEGEDGPTTPPEETGGTTETEPPAETNEPTSTGDTGGGSGGGDTVVKFDDVDLSDVDWEVSCSDTYILADDINTTSGSDYNSVSVSISSDGELDYVMIDEADGKSLWYSASVPELGETTMDYDGSTVSLSGEGYVDSDYTTPIDYEIELSCA